MDQKSGRKSPGSMDKTPLDLLCSLTEKKFPEKSGQSTSHLATSGDYSIPAFLPIAMLTPLLTSFLAGPDAGHPLEKHLCLLPHAREVLLRKATGAANERMTVVAAAALEQGGQTQGPQT